MRMKLYKTVLPMNKFSLITSLFIIGVTFSQDYKGALNKIEMDGLHKIVIPTQVRAASYNNSNSLRIVNSKEEEVPYVLLHASDKTFSRFVAKKIISKKRIRNARTSIVVDNKKREKLDAITLRISNTEIAKRCNVFGSNNGRDWFGLIEDSSLGYLNEKNVTVVEKTISFPLNDYKLLRIDFNDKNSLPINVLEAGVYKSEIFKQEPVVINDFKVDVVTLKEKKITQLKFKALTPHKIDIVSFKINTDFFLRKGKVIVNRNRAVKKRTENYEQVLGVFRLNSKNENTFVFSNLNEKEFVIEIENEDNPALLIESVQLFQKPICIVANLKQNDSYELLLDSLLNRPSYDLGNFISDKTDNIKEARLISFNKVEIQAKKEDVVKTFWETKAFMWLCIVLGGVLIVYFALGLLKDIEANDK